jgi:excisionase family DNA binding protein
MNQTETQSLGLDVAREKGDNGGALDRLLHSVPHAAQLLDLGVSTIWKLVADGRLSTVKIGSSTRIPAFAAPQQSCAKQEAET